MDKPDQPDNVHRFPDAQARKARAEGDARKPSFFSRPSEPVLNLPPVVRRMCLGLFLITLILRIVDARTLWVLVMTLGFVPGRYTGVIAFDWPTVLSPVTHLFIHAGWLHLFVNMGMLMAFGAALEQSMGARRFLILYILSGIAGAFTQVLFYPHSVTPLIGASGAISGLFAGVLMMMYRQGMMGPGGYHRLLPVVAVWIVVSLFFGFFGMPGADGAIAWTAHIGGFLAGFVLFHRLMPAR
jgi:membrane associated rhomboid family serine protease